MRIEEAKRKAEEFVQHIQSQCERLEIVGSIRRGKAQVNDIDLLAIPKDPRRFLCGMQAKVRGPQIIRFEVEGAKIDLYLATPDNYEVLRLIRTGSAQFNVRLCTIAKNKGWEMDFARGLITEKGEIRKEDEILRTLLGRVPEPWERE